jgi:hypothetical protein
MDQRDNSDPDPDKWVFNPEDYFGTDEDDYHRELELEAYYAACEKFTDRYVEKATLITLDFYPQLRSKRKELEEALLKNGKFIFELIDDVNAHYIDGESNVSIEEDYRNEISFNNIDKFLRNSKLDCLMENYDEWFKRKISFENIYVESFYAGVYIKNIHTLIVNIMHNLYPVLACLQSDQLNSIYGNLTSDAFDAYFAITDIDPDEINESNVLYDIEDYEFEDLINYPGPEITRDENGKIISILLPRNELNPAKMPLCCLQCKSYNNIVCLPYPLCGLSRVSQQNSEIFSCRAYEKTDPAEDENDN